MVPPQFTGARVRGRCWPAFPSNLSPPRSPTNTLQHVAIDSAHESDDVSIIRARVGELRGVVGVLLGFGSWVEALEPPELREEMVRIAREALAVYTPPGDRAVRERGPSR